MKPNRTHPFAALALVASLALALAAPPPAAASAAEAQACAITVAALGAFADYRVSYSDTDTLRQGYRMDYNLTLHRGNDYALFACGDGRVRDLDLYVYDEDGTRAAQDTAPDAEPLVEVRPRWTGPATARVVMHDARGGSPAYYTLVVLYRPR